MATAPRELDRPAFYALSSGGWRDLVTILHPPYTFWHLSYVALGAAAAPVIHAGRLLPAQRSAASAEHSGTGAAPAHHCRGRATAARRRARDRAEQAAAGRAARGRPVGAVARARADGSGLVGRSRLSVQSFARFG